MAKVIRGTQDWRNRGGNTQVIKAPAGAVGRLRCPCGGLAIPGQSNDGKAVFKCQGCGGMLKTTPMG